MSFIPPYLYDRFRAPGGSIIRIEPIQCRAKNCDGNLSLRKPIGPYGYKYYLCFTCNQSFDYEYIKHDEELRNNMNNALE